MSEKLDQLSEVLGSATLPGELESLSDRELDGLLTAVTRLKRHQESELERAVEDALSHIPGLLRRSVRKMLFS